MKSYRVTCIAVLVPNYVINGVRPSKYKETYPIDASSIPVALRRAADRFMNCARVKQLRADRAVVYHRYNITDDRCPAADDA